MNMSLNVSQPILDTASHHLAKGSVQSIAGMGAGLGIVYIFTSTDHLTAIVTLANGSWTQTLFHGLRWGCIHALGVLLVFLGILLLPDYDLDGVGPGLNAIIGAVTIAFGIFGLWMARRRYCEKIKKHRKTSSSSNPEQSDRTNLLSSSDDSFQDCDLDNLERNIPTTGVVDSVQPGIEDDCPTKPCSNIITTDDLECDAPAAAEQSLRPDVIQETRLCTPCECRPESPPCNEAATDDARPSDAHRPCAADDFPDTDNSPLVKDDPDPAPDGPRARHAYLLLVFLFGLFDGFAGVSAVLAVIPAVAMRREAARAAAYLGAFLAASVAGTGALAAAWCAASRRFGSPIWLEFAFSAGASLVTIALGIAWEVLLSMDKLDIVFGAR
jgi:hypothetical protein